MPTVSLPKLPGRSTPSTPASKPVVRDELSFLGSRRESTPLSAERIAERIANLAVAAKKRDKQEAADKHEEGTTLVELYMRLADVQLGFPSFRAFLEEHWPLGVDAALARMRFAVAVRATDAQRGLTICQLGLRLLKALKKKTLADLDALPLRVDSSDPKKTKLFAKCSVAELRAALRILRTGPKDEAESGLLKRGRQFVEKAVEAEPLLAELEPTVFKNDAGLCLKFGVAPNRKNAPLAAALLVKFSAL